MVRAEKNCGIEAAKNFSFGEWRYSSGNILLQTAGLFRKTKAERTNLRSEWHKEATVVLNNTDILFVDSDNGLIVPSTEGTVKASKYVEPQELADYYSQGPSVIYYQHKARRNDTFYIEQHKRLLSCPAFDGTTGLGLKFVTTSQRYYFFIIHPKHKDIINEQIQQMMNTSWKDHFCLFPL